MKPYIQRLEQFIIKQDIWLYALAPMLILLIFMTDASPNRVYGWNRFFGGYSVLLFYQLPVLVFVWNKSKIKTRLTAKKYLIFWLFALVVYPLLTILFEDRLELGNPILKFRRYYEIESVSVVAGLTVALSVAIEINSYFNSKPIFIQWIQKIGIDRAILGVMAFFALLLGAMGASNVEVLEKHNRVMTSINENLFANVFSFIGFSIQFFLHYLGLFFFYYINRHFLIPKLLKQKGLFYFVGGAIGSIVVFYPLISQFLLLLPLNETLPSLLPSENHSPFAPINAGVAFGIIAISTPIILILEWFQQNSELATLEKQKVQAELGLLKQQINPHFFFNTLNNLYALSIQKSMQTPEVILQLSELMRYVIYKGQEDKVAIEEEMKYIEDYIQLQQIRLKKKLHLQIDKEITNGKLQIPPLLLIILVENAFKHGIEPAEDAAFLHIVVDGDDTSLSFSCKNSYEPLQERQQGGLGLTNLKRRLEIRFPKKHEFYLYDDDFTFEATLKLELS